VLPTKQSFGAVFCFGKVVKLQYIRYDNGILMKEWTILNSYKILLYVVNSREDDLNGQILNFPIIPRVGDMLNVTAQGKNGTFSGVFKVKTVFINQIGSKVDAQVHVATDEDET